MRRSPSIIPGIDQDVFLVVDDFGSLSQAWRETNIGDTDLEMVICDLLEGQYHNPSWWSASMSRRAGAETSRRTSPVSCRDVAQSGNCLPSWRSSCPGTPAQ